jgi:hypothetical protein
VEKKHVKGSENLIPVKKGEVRNPKGKPPGPNFKTVLAEILACSLPDGQLNDSAKAQFEKRLGRRLTVREGVMIAMTLKALEGDIPAAREILDRMEGKVSQGIEINKDTADVIIWKNS